MKYLSRIFLTLLFTALCITTIEAVGISVVSVGTEQAKAGESVTIPVSIERNIGVESLSLVIEYDESVLTLLSVEDAFLMGGAMHTERYTSPYQLTWENDMTGYYCADDGILVNLTYQISEKAVAGEYPIYIRCPRDGIHNRYGQNETFDVEYGAVIVESGDTNTYNILGTITSSDSDTTTTANDTITIELANTDNVYTITVESSGANKTVDYSIEEVLPGTYTMTVNKANHVKREYTVVVSSDDVTHDVKIYLLGDVNGDGRVNVGDANLVYKHALQTKLITDEYTLLCSNVNGDARVNVGDANLIYKHALQTKKLW